MGMCICSVLFSCGSGFISWSGIKDIKDSIIQDPKISLMAAEGVLWLQVPCSTLGVWAQADRARLALFRVSLADEDTKMLLLSHHN